MVATVKLGLLALLCEQPRCGYQLHTTFVERTGDHWPLNVGQVYSTLQRLERDGLIEATETDEQGRQFYAITAAGRAEVERWFDAPMPRAERPRDDLTVKLAVAMTAGADVRRVVQQQRAVAMHELQGLTLKKAQTEASLLASSLTLESLIFQVEAEIRWLDHCEELLMHEGVSHDRARV
jgi:DNA-binding PadR family transcriptional regulator